MKNDTSKILAYILCSAASTLANQLIVQRDRQEWDGIFSERSASLAFGCVLARDDICGMVRGSMRLNAQKYATEKFKYIIMEVSTITKYTTLRQGGLELRVQSLYIKGMGSTIQILIDDDIEVVHENNSYRFIKCE